MGSEDKTQMWTGADGEQYMYCAPIMRVCEKCKQSFAWDGSDYKKLCTGCYQKAAKKCRACHVNNLPLDAPAWKVTCTSCYLAKKGATHTTCPTCPPELRGHLRCPIGKKQCPTCETHLRVVPRVAQGDN